MLQHLVPPLLKRIAKLDKEDDILDTLKRNPNDDVARTMFKAIHAAFRGAFDVLDQSELLPGVISDEQQKGITAGIVSLSGAIIHALHNETAADEDQLYRLFDIPEKHISKMKQASESTKRLFEQGKSAP
jgi:hypothetical protein